MRIGIGYDAHRLAEGRKLIIGGVEIPYERGLDGYSDADVLIHAIMDAMLGAAALGDLGVLFPDNDPEYLGISSMMLLRLVSLEIAKAGYIVGNIDSTIIAQKPRMRDHIDMMRNNIAEILGIYPEQVSIKATTEEKMGFTGREEGISAQAVVLLEEVE